MHEDEGNNPAPRTKHRRQDNKGCSGSSLRRGLFAHVVLRQQAAGGKILRSGLPGPCSPALSSNGHRRKRWSGRGVARKRRRGWSVAFGVAVRGMLAVPRAWL
jgi:hypothetical protein